MRNPDKAKRSSKKSRGKPTAKEKTRKRVAKWIKANPDLYKIIRLKSDNKIKEELTNGYIKSLICGNYSSGLTFDDIPNYLVELWRLQIKTQRIIKSKTND